jgi:hypothetical protein
MKIRHVAAAASVVGALTLAGPALAGGDHGGGKPPKEPCPRGYILTFDVFNVTGADANDNDMVCVKATPFGDVFVDDRV